MCPRACGPDNAAQPTTRGCTSLLVRPRESLQVPTRVCSRGGQLLGKAGARAATGVPATTWRKPAGSIPAIPAVELL